MRTSFLITLCLVALCTFSVQAQPPYAVFDPASGQLSFAAVVGQSVTRQVNLVRYDPNFETAAVLGLQVPFSTPANPVTFKFSDTLSVDFTFTPESVGEFDVPVVFFGSGFPDTVMLKGYGFAIEDQRYESSSEDADLGTVVDDGTSSTSFVLTNKWVRDLTLYWDDLGPALTFFVDGVETNEVTIPTGTKVVVTAQANGAYLQPGYWERMISVTDGDVIGPGNQTVTSVNIGLHGVKFDSQSTPLIFNPDPVTILFDPIEDDWQQAAVVITNISPLQVTLNAASFTGANANLFSVVNSNVFPVSVESGQSFTLAVTSTSETTDSVFAVLQIEGLFPQDTSTYVLGSVTVTAANVLEQVPPIMLTMTANDAKVGEVCRAVFTNGSDLPGDADHAIVTLRYNTTVLVPRTFPLDLEDPISEGKRTSRFRLTPDGHSMGQRAGEVEFDVVLGNSSSTALEVVSIDWKDEANNSLGMHTQVNGTTVSVLDAQGFEINADAGPLSMSVTPMPITGTGTVRYDVGGLPGATLKMYDRTGSMVADLTPNITQGDGTFTLSASPFPKGFYYLQLAGGPYTVVTLVIME